MFPGLTTKLSEEAISLTTTISPSTDLVAISSTTTTTVLVQIRPPFGGFPGIMIIVNRSGNAVTTLTTGNIEKAVSIPDKQNCLFVFSALTNKYYPGAIS